MFAIVGAANERRMALRYFLVSTFLLGSMTGCQSDDSDEDWRCSGSQGKALTCDSSQARPILASKYDAGNSCFEAFASPSEWCAVNTMCAGGGGTTVCAVAPSGVVYLTYLLYGEETTMPSWRFDDPFIGTSPLTSAEESLCKSAWAAFEGLVDADGGSADERTLSANSTSTRATPACD
jgi:hypothetical protein